MVFVPRTLSSTPIGAQVPAARAAGDQGDADRLGVTRGHAVAERPHPHAPRQRPGLLLHHLQPHHRLLRLPHPAARLLPGPVLHGHLHAARLPGQAPRGWGSEAGWGLVNGWIVFRHYLLRLNVDRTFWCKTGNHPLYINIF